MVAGITRLFRGVRNARIPRAGRILPTLSRATCPHLARRGVLTDRSGCGGPGGDGDCGMDGLETRSARVRAGCCVAVHLLVVVRRPVPAPEARRVGGPL